MGDHDAARPPLAGARELAVWLLERYRRVRKAVVAFLASGGLVAGFQVLNGIDWTRPSAYLQPLALALATSATVYATRNGPKTDQTAG